MSDQFKFTARANDAERRAEAVGAILRIAHAAASSSSSTANATADHILANLEDYATRVEKALVPRD